MLFNYLIGKYVLKITNNHKHAGYRRNNRSTPNFNSLIIYKYNSLIYTFIH